MSESQKNALALLGLQSGAESSTSGEPDEFLAFLAKENARHERNYQRVEKWALRQTKEVLATALAWAVVERATLRSVYRLSRESSAAALETAGSIQRDLSIEVSVREHLVAEYRPYVAAGVKALRDRRKGAAAKLAADPKQVAKAQARAHWEKWQSGNARHASGAAFAQFIVSTYADLKSVRVVEKWTREWAAEKKARRAE